MSDVGLDPAGDLASIQRFIQFHVDGPSEITGQLEKLGNDVAQLKNSFERLKADTDQRFAAAPAPAPVAPQPASTIAPPQDDSAPAGTLGGSDAANALYQDAFAAVREGRRREYRKAYEAFGDDVPDPVEQTTFVHAKLNWQELQNPDGQRRHKLVRKLLALRREHIIPHLRVASFGEAHVEPDGILFASWALNDHLLTLTANLSSEPSAKETPHGRHMIWGKSGLLGPWSVCWTTESA